jgi:DNA-directed RNA polymerase subunit H (RpoH/RPB5)
MDHEDIDVLYRSRLTLLKILRAKGYNTTQYEKFGPFEIKAMAAAATTVDNGFNMSLERSSEAAVAAGAPGILRCRVLYTPLRMKQRLGPLIENLTAEEEGNEMRIDTASTEVLVMLMDSGDMITSENQVYDTASLNAFAKHKLRIFFFQVRTLVNNPLEHEDVPKHELMPKGEEADFLKANKIRSKANLPLIRFHNDIIARLIGALPGDIVKITRPSPSAGVYISYRVCWP